jgi:hypothetical protein
MRERIRVALTRMPDHEDFLRAYCPAMSAPAAGIPQ